jgi:hypothetical protein
MPETTAEKPPGKEVPGKKIPGKEVPGKKILSPMVLPMMGMAYGWMWPGQRIYMVG